MMNRVGRNSRCLDFRIFENYNLFFVGFLWLLLIIQWKFINLSHAITFLTLLIIYSSAILYNLMMRGNIKNNEITSLAFINIFACVPLLNYSLVLEQIIFILLVWASIIASTFKEKRNTILFLVLLSSCMLFISYFEGNLNELIQISIFLMKTGVIVFVGISFAQLQDNYHQETVGVKVNNRLKEKIIADGGRLEKVTSVAIASLAMLTESRDPDTGSHLERMKAYIKVLANELRQEEKFKAYINDKYIEELVQSSILHDIGKVGIPDKILLKKKSLSPEERKTMMTHTIIGGNTLKNASERVGEESFLNLAQSIAYYHHEKYNGTGYPKGLKGEEIPLSARIVCLADVYDALRCDRVYKEALSHEKTIKMMREEMIGSFDPVIFKAFERIADKFSEIADNVN